MTFSIIDVSFVCPALWLSTVRLRCMLPHSNRTSSLYVVLQLAFDVERRRFGRSTDDRRSKTWSSVDTFSLLLSSNGPSTLHFCRTTHTRSAPLANVVFNHNKTLQFSRTKYIGYTMATRQSSISDFARGVQSYPPLSKPIIDSSNTSNQASVPIVCTPLHGPVQFAIHRGVR